MRIHESPPPQGRRPSWRPTPRLAVAVLVVVVALHLLVLLWLLPMMRVPTGRALPPPVYTRLLKPAPAPAITSAAPRATATPARHLTPPPPQAAPTPRTPLDAPASASAATTPKAPVPAASAASGAASTAAAPGGAHGPARPAASAARAAAPGKPSWPPSTLINYVLRGQWHGPLRGTGSLDWQRDGDRYKADLSGSALIGFGYSSSGRIDGDWLAPDDYDERVFTRHKHVFFDRAHGLLRFTAISSTLPLPPRLQDSASIFMQLAHALTAHPESFRAGQQLTFEVARPSGTTTWVFTLMGEEPVATALGTLLCWHLSHADTSHGLGADVWLAPGLQNLPIQIRLEEGDGSFLMFTLRDARQQ